MKKFTFLLLALFITLLSSAQYSSIAIVGTGVGGWPTGAAGEIDSHQMTTSDGVHWSLNNLVTTAGAVKFRANNSWTSNWGAPSGSFPSGTGVANGSNISVPVGVYDVTFNSNTLAFSFSVSSLYPTISLAGAGVGNTDIDLGTTDGIHYSGNGIAINGEVKFRKNHADINIWSPPTFPSGIAIANGTNMLNVGNSTYNVSFNLTTLEYAFNYPKISIVGSATPQGWPVDPQVDAHVLSTTDGIHYIINNLTLTNAAVKFRQDNGWTVQWGGDGGFPNGTGLQNGIDINVPAGTFSITLNRLTGAYSFNAPLGTSTAPNCTLVPVSSATATTGDPLLAIDGNSSTRWESTATGNQSIILDLGAISAVSALSISWDTYSAAHYVLLGSTDGNSWLNISDLSNMSYGARTDVVENIDQQYRYLKIDCITGTTQYGYAIYEINICGTPIVPGTEKRILFIGNSYTYYNAMPTMVENVAASMGDELIATSSTVGGTSLEEHFVNNGTLGKLQQGAWDYVVLQENSTRPALTDSYVEEHVYPFADQLATLARNSSPCSDLFFYQTWGRENGDADNCPSIPEVCTYEGMDDRVAMRYGQMANDNLGSVSPVGAVRREIRQLYPEIDLYLDDQSHPTLAGSYVSAVTFYTALYRKDPTLITFNSTLSETTANQIKAVVKSVLFDNFTRWSIGAYDPDAVFAYETNNQTVSFTNTSTNSQEYVWDFGDGTTSTEQNPIHVFSGEGPYTITLTAAKCDKQSITTQQISILNTVSYNNKYFTVYPNPSQSVWNITSAEAAITTIQVMDITGKTVMYINPQGNTAQIDATQLSAGVYLAKISSATAVETVRLMKN